MPVPSLLTYISIRGQPSVRALQERMEQLCQRSAASALQLEQAQHLLAQFSEALDELWPWLEETQDVGMQLAPSASGYDAFREQQALLQVRAWAPQRRGYGGGRDLLMGKAGTWGRQRWWQRHGDGRDMVVVGMWKWWGGGGGRDMGTARR